MLESGKFIYVKFNEFTSYMRTIETIKMIKKYELNFSKNSILKKISLVLIMHWKCISNNQPKLDCLS